jgi:hypothetical protein
MNNLNIKNYDDLLNDTENTWDLEENLEELLFDCEDMLTETVSSSYLRPISKGDIIMASNGKSQRKHGMDVMSPHRIFIVEDATGEYGSRIFKGYLLSSQVRKANYYNDHFPDNIYIDNYSTILAKGPQHDTEAFIKLSDLYVIDEQRMDRSHGGFWKGHAKQEFIDFIDAAAATRRSGKAIGNLHWIDGKATK